MRSAVRYEATVHIEPLASAAFGGNLSLSWLLHKVMPQKYDD
jgi:hypothetical protein